MKRKVSWFIIVMNVFLFFIGMASLVETAGSGTTDAAGIELETFAVLALNILTIIATFLTMEKKVKA